MGHVAASRFQVALRQACAGIGKSGFNPNQPRVPAGNVPMAGNGQAEVRAAAACLSAFRWRSATRPVSVSSDEEGSFEDFYGYLGLHVDFGELGIF